MEAQRHWLAGFGAAWVERQDALSLDDALAKDLEWLVAHEEDGFG